MVTIRHQPGTIMDNKEYLTIEESAEVLGVDPSAVEKLVQDGVFRAVRIGVERRIGRNYIEAFRSGRIRAPRKKYPPHSVE